MQRVVLVNGIIGGLIVAVLGIIGVSIFCNSGNFEGGMIYGYTSMVLAFSMIFVGIKSYRDKYNGGTITFGKALK